VALLAVELEEKQASSITRPPKNGWAVSMPVSRMATVTGERERNGPGERTTG
jgi:hypothetical protein